ncbi:MAG: OadG family protein [Eubacteriales bacterium]|nr:OadG family protein [Eubacteriales bacterium]
MSLSQALGQGLMVTGVGLLIVFSVLIILMLVMMLMKKVFYKEPQKAETVQIEKKSDASANNAAPPTLNAAQDPNLIAVLTAAVAVCMNTSTYNLKIKSYRRVDNNAPVWNKAGLNDAINSRY